MIAVSYKLFPSESITTIAGKFSTLSFLIASVPRSSYATTSDSTIAFESKAPAPPMAARYTALFLTMASITSLDLFPFQIIPRSPISRSSGAYLSILLDVVGPAEPIGRPSLAGEGPI